MVRLTVAINHKVGRRNPSDGRYHRGVIESCGVCQSEGEVNIREVEELQEKHTLKGAGAGISMSQNTFVDPSLSSARHVLIVALFPKKKQK